MSWKACNLIDQDLQDPSTHRLQVSADCRLVDGSNLEPKTVIARTCVERTRALNAPPPNRCAE